jgi:putative ABC transport system permease protein
MSDDDDLERELRVHLEFEADDQRERGLADADARDAARRVLGNQARIKEEIHDQSRSALFDSLARDVQYGTRMLRRHPTFTLVVAATLALGVAASTALFAVVHNVLLRPLASPDANRVVLVYNAYPNAGIPHAASAAADYDDRRRAVPAFDEHALYTLRNPSVEIAGTPERIHAMHTTASFFRLLGVNPREGRAFAEEEEAPGRNRVVLLAEPLARRLFPENGAVGRSVRIDGEPHTIAGVMPQGFALIDAGVQMWLPLTVTPQERRQLHANNWQYLGRLKPGATLQQAQAQIDAVNAANLGRAPAALRTALTNTGFHSIAVRLQDDLVRDLRTALALLWAGSVFMLVMGSVNVASLVLARSRARAREITTRVALGAGQWRIVRQLAIEHLLLTLASGAAGIALASAALRLFARVRIEHLPPEAVTRIDGVVVAYTIATTAMLGVALGAVPMLGGIFSDPIGALRDEGRTSTSGRGRTLRRALVVAQIATACVLLSGAGLLLASFRHVLAVDPGFDGGQTLTAAVELPRARYPDDASLRRFASQALDAMRALPGALSAGATTAIPFGNDFGTRLIMAEGYQPAPGESFIGPYRSVVTPGYFEAMKVGLVSGRFFADADTPDSVRVAIVDTTLARRFWPGVDPIGRRLFFPDANNLTRITEKTPVFVVVGVVREVKLRGLVEGVGDVGAYYFPHAQAPERRLTFAIRSAVDPPSLAPDLRRSLAAIDRELPVFDVQPMARLAEQSLASRRTATLLAIAFGAVALVLAAIGIYGVLAYLVAQRTKELGIRIALGSTRGGVFRLVLGEGFALIAVGAAIGAAAAPLLARSIRSQLFGISSSDPLILSLAVATLVIVGVTACVIPARRATRIDPVLALSE